MPNVIKSSSKKPSEVVALFIKKLDTFIKESIDNINKMKARHAQMASFWKGEQYDQFTSVLSQSIKDAAKELMELQKLRKELAVKLEILRKQEANRI